MKRKELEQYAEDCQQAADELAYKYVIESEEILSLSILQSYCDFNLFWLTSISPVLLHSESVKFLLKNKVDIKSKFSIQQLFDFDTRYRWLSLRYEIKDLEHYKQLLKKHKL